MAAPPPEPKRHPGPRVLETALVLPSAPAPPESSFPLTFFDILWINSPPVERLLFYRLAPGADVDAVVSGLKSSLSEAVRAFYPLAGSLRPSPIAPRQYELHYRPGDGVAFTLAECDADFDALAADAPREVAAMATLVPSLPKGGAVLALQATILSARRGIALGVTVHHAGCDGAVSTHFLHTWAAACVAGSRQQVEPPVIDRTLIPDPRDLYDVFFKFAPTTDDMEIVKKADDQLLSTFTVSKDDVQRVKDAVAAEAARRGVAPLRCSTLVATLGLMWSCYERAKATTAAGGDNRCLLFAVDQRSRMKPPVPEKYLGNCVGPAFAFAPQVKLAAAGDAALFAACAAVAASIDEAVASVGTPAMDSWLERLKEAFAMSALTLAGSPRFRVYDMDFGFGTPAKVDMVSVARTGALSLAESPRQGGALEVGVSLQPDCMERFRECLADAVARLAGTVE